MGEREWFPIMADDRDPPETPRRIPWAMIAPFENQAQHNHDQSLRRLAERGGLHSGEALDILDRQKYGTRYRSLPRFGPVPWSTLVQWAAELNQRVAEWQKAQGRDGE